MADALPVLYLMAPMTLYGTDVLAQARQFPFGTLAGPVTVDCAEGMFPDAAAWAAAWPALRERYSFGVFLDHLGGWVPRGVFAEACDLAAAGKPVWWLDRGVPVRRFGFAPGRPGDWRYCYRRVYRMPEAEEAAPCL